MFALMDVKGHNETRLIDLHGIISEGIHKIEDLEENVKSLFIAVMNPEDKEKIENIQSFRDRITEISLNYILNYTEEVKIYFNAFGTQIKKNFLPGVLENFAKIIISTRLDPKSEAIKEWIKNPEQYKIYCDKNMLLLKMHIYTNIIPSWLTDDDRKALDKRIRRMLINESEHEGTQGFSGRESINIFNEFYSLFRKKTKNGDINSFSSAPITMDEVKNFFIKKEEFSKKVPEGFLDSIVHLYDYNIMQEIKESLFNHNENRISKDIQNYLFAINYDVGDKLLSPYTGETIEISLQLFESIEKNLLKKDVSKDEREKFRHQTASKFAIILQQMNVGNGGIKGTKIYKDLYNTYMNNLRENIFQPFLKYTAFENSIKEFGTTKFDIYDARTKEEVTYLLNNLVSKFNYTVEGAKQVCLYAINNKIAERFTT